VRISRPRLILRAALLLVAAGLVATRAVQDGREAALPGIDPGAARLLGRIALVEWVLAALAVLTAAAALLALRQKPRRHTLHLKEGTAGDGGNDGRRESGIHSVDPGARQPPPE
jgi:hypothetical protein